MNRRPLRTSVEAGRKAARSRKAMRRKPLPSYRPHRCVILGVDPGKHAGWAIWVEGKLVQWGEVDGLDIAAVQNVVAGALQLAELASVRCVLAIEKPPVHHRAGHRSFSSLLGSGETRASWRLAWLAAKQSERRIVKVDVLGWRAAEGIGRVPRETAKRAELLRAGLVVQDEGCSPGPRSGCPLIGPESAPAILIGHWATRAGEVAAVLPEGERGT